MKVAAKTVCDRFKSKIRLLRLYRDGSEGALLLLEYRTIRDKEVKFLTGLSAATQADGRIHAI